MVVKEEQILGLVVDTETGKTVTQEPLATGGCARADDATATTPEGSEFSPRIRRILEAQPLSPLRRAVLSGPVVPSPVSASTEAMQALDLAVCKDILLHDDLVTIPLTYTPQTEEEVVVKQNSFREDL